MRLSFTTESGEVLNLEVDSQMELENIKALIENETEIAPADQVLYYNGKELTDPKKTLEQYGVIQDDILLLKKRPSVAEDIRHTVLSQPGLLQQLLENQPELADAVNDPSRFTALIRRLEQQHQEVQKMQQVNMLNADPFNLEAQRKIEEEIRLQNVYENMDNALEHNPEIFGEVTMLYINVKVNKHPVKAFVDSGAQTTIMSSQCAENCGIMRLVDKRFAGIAEGVGTAEIVGRVHHADICVGTELYLACSFTIINGGEVDLLFGLDMLKRHQACIDLKKNALIINGIEIPFLPEYELPKKREKMRNNLRVIASSSNTESSSTSTDTIANQPHLNSSSPVSQQSQQQSQYPEEHIQSLISMWGITRDEAIRYLDLTNGNVDLAASLLMDKN